MFRILFVFFFTIWIRIRNQNRTDEFNRLFTIMIKFLHIIGRRNGEERTQFIQTPNVMLFPHVHSAQYTLYVLKRKYLDRYSIEMSPSASGYQFGVDMMTWNVISIFGNWCANFYYTEFHCLLCKINNLCNSRQNNPKNDNLCIAACINSQISYCFFF